MTTVLPFAARVLAKVPKPRAGRALPPNSSLKDGEEIRFEAFEALGATRRRTRLKPLWVTERAIDALLAVVYVAACAALAWAGAVAL